MRATISFEIEVDQVEGTMGLLAAQEAHNLRAAADLLEDYTGPRTQVLGEVTEALRLLRETTTQLAQYRNMLVSFERSRFETILPQSAMDLPPPAPPTHTYSAAPEKKQFDDFLGRIGEDTSDEDAEEG
jgi:hypothetical protein